MNTNMTDKYYKMHTEVLDICEDNGIRMIPGKRVSCEIFNNAEIRGIKEFLVLPDDMGKFHELCAGKLKDNGYTVVKGKFKNYNFCRIFREDILASSVPALMNNPDGRHSPQFILRELAEADGRYSYSSNGEIISFDAEQLDDLEKTSYGGSCIYVKRNLKAHLHQICGMEDENETVLPGYALFSTEFPAAEYLKEAQKRGLLSQERISRYNEYTAWRKENRTGNEKKYREYQDVLLGLKQP